jgi:hypothetical protein
MNQRVLLLLLNRYSKGQALYHKRTRYKLPYQLSWFNPNQPASLEFDILPTYQNSTRRSVLNSYPIYNIERITMVVLYRLAKRLSFIATRIYQKSTKASNLVLLKPICQRISKRDCFDKELKMIRWIILLTKSADSSNIYAPVHIFTR